jgi:hypothetical protein
MAFSLAAASPAARRRSSRTTLSVVPQLPPPLPSDRPGGRGGQPSRRAYPRLGFPPRAPPFRGAPTCAEAPGGKTHPPTRVLCGPCLRASRSGKVRARVGPLGEAAPALCGPAHRPRVGQSDRKRPRSDWRRARPPGHDGCAPRPPGLEALGNPPRSRRASARASARALRRAAQPARFARGRKRQSHGNGSS